MRWLARQKLSPIGLDVGSRAVKAVQLSGAPGAWSLAAATLIPRSPRQQTEPEVPSVDSDDLRETRAADAEPAKRNASLSDEELQRIARVLPRQGFVGDRLVLAVPHQQLRSGIIELPSRKSGAPLEQIARMETASIHRLAPTAFEFTWAELPATSRQHELTRAMVAACPHADADALLDRFAEHNLDVAVLDVAAAALARLADVAEESHHHVLAVIDLGQEAATLVIIYQGTVIYERRLPEAGFAALAGTLTREFEIEDRVARYLLEEVGLVSEGEHPDAMPGDMRALIQDQLADLVRELNISLSYAQHQYPDVEIGPLMLVGGAARMPNLAEALSHQLPQNASVLTPAQRVAASDTMLAAAADPAMSLAAALAMHEHGGRL